MSSSFLKQADPLEGFPTKVLNEFDASVQEMQLEQLKERVKHPPKTMLDTMMFSGLVGGAGGLLTGKHQHAAPRIAHGLVRGVSTGAGVRGGGLLGALLAKRLATKPGLFPNPAALEANSTRNVAMQVGGSLLGGLAGYLGGKRLADASVPTVEEDEQQKQSGFLRQADRLIEKRAFGTLTGGLGGLMFGKHEKKGPRFMHGVLRGGMTDLGMGVGGLLGGAVGGLAGASSGNPATAALLSGAGLLGGAGAGALGGFIAGKPVADTLVPQELGQEQPQMSQEQLLQLIQQLQAQHQ